MEFGISIRVACGDDMDRTSASGGSDDRHGSYHGTERTLRQRDGEGHAILTLRTQRGEFILDNLDRRVVAWRDTPYRFLKRQSVADPGRWNRVEDGNAVLVGSVKD